MFAQMSASISLQRLQVQHLQRDQEALQKKGDEIEQRMETLNRQSTILDAHLSSHMASLAELEALLQVGASESVGLKDTSEWERRRDD